MKVPRFVAVLVGALALVLLVGGCSKAPAVTPEPLPSWSPPLWMHGSWSATGDMIDVTLVATAHNIVIEIQLGGEPFKFDLKQKSEGGTATVLHHVEVLDGQRTYAVSIAEGGSRDDFICAEVDATTMSCSWLYETPTGDEIPNGPFLLMKLVT